MNTEEIEARCAEVAHEANRVYCEAIGDHSQRPWATAEQWQRDSAIQGVRVALAGASSADQHEAWCAHKRDDGWVHGEVKDAVAKTHPCLVPYHDLPETQRRKDALYGSVVRAMQFALAPETLDTSRKTLGQIGFEAYDKNRGHKTWNGQPTPPWDKLTDGVREGWGANADAIVAALDRGRPSLLDPRCVVLDLSSLGDVLDDVAEVLRASTTGLEPEDAEVLDNLADAFEEAAHDPISNDCHSCEAPPGTPCAADCASQ